MPTAWMIAEEIYRNARTLKVHEDHVINYQPVREFLTNSLRLVTALQEEESFEIAREAIRRVWLLHNAVKFSLVSFDHIDLRLSRQLEDAEHSLSSITDTPSELEALTAATQFLCSHPHNPKRARMIQLIGRLIEEDHPENIGIVSPPAWRVPSCWCADFIDKSEFPGADIEIIERPSDLRRRMWSVIILPFGGNTCGFVRQVFEGYRCSQIYKLRYSQEPPVPYDRSSLLKIVNRRNQEAENKLSPVSALNRDSLEEEDLEREFWKTCRELAALRTQSNYSAESDAYSIAARLLLLPHENMLYLATEKDQLVSRVLSDTTDHDPLVYVSVPEIQSGDYVALRTGASTDLARSLGEVLMRQDGHSDLYSSGLDWKPMLRAALRRVGTTEFTRLLDDEGITLQVKNYVWSWTGELVMRPGTLLRFQMLMKAISKCGSYSSDISLDEYTEDRWEKMKVIENYNRKAGFRIRRALLRKLENILSESTNLEDEYHIHLDEEFSNAEISLYRVLDIDKSDSQVDETAIGRIIALERDLWRE